MSDGPLCDKCEQPSEGDFLRVCRKCAERAEARVKELEAQVEVQGKLLDYVSATNRGAAAEEER